MTLRDELLQYLKKWAEILQLNWSVELTRGNSKGRNDYAEAHLHGGYMRMDVSPGRLLTTMPAGPARRRMVSRVALHEVVHACVAAYAAIASQADSPARAAALEEYEESLCTYVERIADHFDPLADEPKS